MDFMFWLNIISGIFIVIAVWWAITIIKSMRRKDGE